MSIRWKFLMVLLVFSIVPLLGVIALSQVGIIRLGETISELMSNILTQSAGAELAQTAVGSSRMLDLHLERIEHDLVRSAEHFRDGSPEQVEFAARQDNFAGSGGFPEKDASILSNRFILPGTLRVEKSAIDTDSVPDSSRPRVRWGRPTRQTGSGTVKMSASIPVGGSGLGAEDRVTVDIALSDLLESAMLESLWSIRMHSFLVAIENAPDGDEPRASILAARDSADHPNRWRPADGVETFGSLSPAQVSRLLEQLVRRESGFFGWDWNGKPAVWAYAPVGRRLALVNVSPGMVVDVARDVLAFAKWQWVDTVAASLAVLLVLVAVAFWRSKAMTASFQQMVEAVERLGRGDFGSRMHLQTGDEREQVAAAFNAMVPHLEDRMQIRKALEVAQEIQQALLPAVDPEIPGYSVSAKSLYSDETGGDYFDYFPCGDSSCSTDGFVVGDVTGHGVGAALLMATARAFVRAEMQRPGDLAERIRRVNRLLTMDTRHTGNFMSLFFLEIDRAARRFRWVRAGHDPAILFDPSRGIFEELGGPGMVLGVDDGFVYEQRERTIESPGTVLLLGTDGIWEAHDGSGALFGKNRLKEIIRENAGRPAQGIRDAVLDAVRKFREGKPVEDDMTLIVIKSL
ncbi:MAG: PP2C family protein-serine/threonine phosphatase [Desulfobacterales bacterium]